MELLREYVTAVERGERMLWLIVRAALDSGAEPEDVAAELRMSLPTMYRRLRDQGLTHGRGRPPGRRST